MATDKKRLRYLLLLFVIFTGTAPLLTAQSAGYFINTENGESRFIQRLAWRGGENSLRYEVVLEREVNGRYTAHLRNFTSAAFIEVSLPPGQYRFQVIPYDILDRPGEGSGWVHIEVLQAQKPEILNALPEYVPGGSGGSSGYVLNLTGINIIPGAEFIIRRSDGTQIVPDVLDSGEGGDVRIFIDSEMSASGEFEIIVRNPGGLEATIGGVTLPEPVLAAVPEPQIEPVLAAAPEPQIEPVFEPEPEPESVTEGDTEQVPAFVPLENILFNLGLAWMPVLPLHGQFFGEGSSPLGFTAYLSVIFNTPMNIYIGPELTVFWFLGSYQYMDENDYYWEEYPTEVVGALAIGANLLAVKWLSNQRMAVNFRVGVSFIMFEIENIMFNIGASFLWRFNNKHLEIGFDYASLFIEDSSGGCIRPRIGFGIQM